MKHNLRTSLLSIGIAALLSGCTSTSNLLNPFYESPTPEAQMGERSDRALNESEGKAEKARAALEAMSEYNAAQTPRPYDPVMQPAVVRLMWVPDRVNKHGDLIPAHYYYLKVLSDRWAVSDAFELEAQLNKGGSGASGGAASNVPFTTKDDMDASK
jgi:hypothetical protein